VSVWGGLGELRHTASPSLNSARYLGGKKLQKGHTQNVRGRTCNQEQTQKVGKNLNNVTKSSSSKQNLCVKSEQKILKTLWSETNL
jgi:hypothetical protein